ncbi:iron-containing alcohol dehydrogenase [Desulfosediminicola flagellatus]|uniref:iron-containing alcohol dehydrogenase n=1 Tax=Desulfosediminicola flagellatus TaxID=2569541 RepID=UPI0010AD0C66|nr:iron-containing alcohol dehydrogenase [Desulfosediminicola flagellatus]
MHNFVFHNPTKVLFGKGTIQHAGKELAFYGKRALLIYGQNSANKNGLLHTVKGSLTEAEIEFVEHGGAKANPTVEHVRKGIQIAKSEKIDCICALGGGSVIDSAKAISAGALVEHDVWKFFTGKKSVKNALPLIAISTLAASGSEMNSGMVLTNQHTLQKFGFAHRLLFPKVAIMDPETTYTVSPQQTAYGAIDSLAHILEFYMTSVQNGTVVQDRYMEGLAMAILESCDNALKNAEDYEARSSLMWSAALTLNGLSSSGLGKVGFPMHLIEHSLSAIHDIPHGAGLSIIIPAWFRYQAKHIPERMSQFFSRIFGITGTPQEVSEHGIQILTTWLTNSGAPTTLGEVGISTAEIPRLAENALPLAKVWRMREYDQKKIEEILQLCG